MQTRAVLEANKQMAIADNVSDLIGETTWPRLAHPQNCLQHCLRHPHAASGDCRAGALCHAGGTGGLVLNDSGPAMLGSTVVWSPLA